MIELAASLITFRGLWAATGSLPPPPAPAVASDEEGDGQEEKEAEPYAVESGISESTSSYVEVKATQA